MIKVLFVNLLLAHLISDFWLQSDGMVLKKRKFGIKGGALYLHALIVAAVACLSAADYRFLPFAAVLSIGHFFVDYIKTRLPERLWSFAIDQGIHIVVLYLVARCYICCFPDWMQVGWISEGFELSVPALACAIVFCTTPANFLIRETLAEFRIDARNKKCDMGHNTSSSSELKNAGALIGVLERLLILLFVLIGNYEAAGLTVAAKSILRFKDDEGPRTEFVLVGTLLSFLIAVVTAVIILACVFDFRNLKG